MIGIRRETPTGAGGAQEWAANSTIGRNHDAKATPEMEPTYITR